MNVAVLLFESSKQALLVSEASIHLFTVFSVCTHCSEHVPCIRFLQLSDLASLTSALMEPKAGSMTLRRCCCRFLSL
jgi:hypothetical protein